MIRKKTRRKKTTIGLTCPSKDSDIVMLVIILVIELDVVTLFEYETGGLPYKPIRDVPFFRISFFSINYDHYDHLFKNSKLLFSRTINYCFPIVFGIFCNLIIPKQGIEMQIVFPNGLWRFLKNGHLPVKLHSIAPPPSPPRI